MQIEQGKVVRFHYSLKDDAGSFIEESHGAEPTTYLHGSNNILSAMEVELLGKQAGDNLEITLAPEQAYGEYRPESVQRVPLKHLVRKGVKAKPGQVLRVETDQGPKQVLVMKVGKFNADVDTNHPLAGKTLTFAIEIVEVRDASAEEVAHGHAHGPGGHHH